MWTKDDIRILLIDDMTDDPIVTARISTPGGEVTVMAEAEEVATTIPRSANFARSWIQAPSRLGHASGFV